MTDGSSGSAVGNASGGSGRRARRSLRAETRPIATEIGRRIRASRIGAGLTQHELASPRYTKAYISALENGSCKPSMAALTYIADRLGMPVVRFLEDGGGGWSRLAADLELAAGHWQQAVDAYTELLAGETNEGRRAEILLGLAEACAGMDMATEAVTAAAEASDTFDRLGRGAEAALARYWLACGVYQQGNTGESKAILEEILARVRAGLAVEPDFHARLLMALSSNASQDGEHESALGYLAEIRHLADQLDDRRRGVYLFDLSHSYRETGDYEAAIRTGLAGLALLRAANLDFEWAGLLNGLARSYLALGNTAKAAEAIREARATFERLGDRRWLSYVSEADAEVCLAAGDADAAARHAEEALALAEDVLDEKGALDALVTLARARRERGLTEEVLALYDRAADLARKWGRASRIREVMGEYADALAEAGHQARAFDVARSALRIT